MLRSATVLYFPLAVQRYHNTTIVFTLKRKLCVTNTRSNVSLEQQVSAPRLGQHNLIFLLHLVTEHPYLYTGAFPGFRRYILHGQEVARLNLDDDSLSINVGFHQNHQHDAKVAEVLEENHEVTKIMVSVGRLSLQNWPLSLEHLKMRNNLQKIALFVSPRTLPSEIAGLLGALQHNGNIEEFWISSLFRLQELRVPVQPLVSFLDAGAAHLKTVALDCDVTTPNGSIVNADTLLATSVQHCTNLRYLRLGSGLHWMSVEKIFNALGRNHPVQTLEIKLDAMNQLVWPSLAKLVKRTANIRLLVINSQVVIQRKWEQTILRMAKSNFSLREIRFVRHGLVQEEDRRKLQK